jgi:hypothetical protein
LTKLAVVGILLTLTLIFFFTRLIILRVDIVSYDEHSLLKDRSRESVMNLLLVSLYYSVTVKGDFVCFGLQIMNAYRYTA